ncbi:MAG: HAD family phosphatase [Eubacterium sp.]|nr:HAD family phosphatase [Eubacterium sp.]
MIKCVIFDMDGTLLDSETVGLIAWQKVIDKFSLDMDLTLPIASIGLNYNSMERLFADNMGADFPFRKYWDEAKVFCAEYEKEHGVAVKKGFDSLSRFLKENGIKSVVATSTYHNSAVKKLTNAGIWDCFDGLFGGDEIVNGKPDPEIFLKAAELFGYTKDEQLIVEDSENGVRAALSAGIRCVYIKDIKDIEPQTESRVFARTADLSGVADVIKGIS